MTSHLRLSSFALAVSGLFACASSPSATGASSLTAADVASEPPPAAPEPADRPSSDKPSSPPGEVVCRAKDAFGVVNELSITWTSEGGSGFLRRITPSGMEEELRVRAERYRDLVIADAPNETDLMSHLAVVGRHKGKLHMRVGSPTPSWVLCE